MLQAEHLSGSCNGLVIFGPHVPLFCVSSQTMLPNVQRSKNMLVSHLPSSSKLSYEFLRSFLSISNVIRKITLPPLLGRLHQVCQMRNDFSISTAMFRHSTQKMRSPAFSKYYCGKAEDCPTLGYLPPFSQVAPACSNTSRAPRRSWA